MQWTKLYSKFKGILCLAIMLNLITGIISLDQARYSESFICFLVLFSCLSSLSILCIRPDCISYSNCTFLAPLDIANFKEVHFHSSTIAPKNCNSAIHIKGHNVTLTGGKIFTAGGYGIYLEGRP